LAKLCLHDYEDCLTVLYEHIPDLLEAELLDKLEFDIFLGATS